MDTNTNRKRIRKTYKGEISDEPNNRMDARMCFRCYCWMANNMAILYSQDARATNNTHGRAEIKMDKDIEEYLKVQAKTANSDDSLIADKLATLTTPIITITLETYEESESEGNEFVSSIIESMLVISSKSLDQSLHRLDKIHEISRKNIIRLDKEAQK